MNFEIKFPTDVLISLPDGASLEFKADTWVYYKPRWATRFPMEQFIDIAVDNKVVIKDINLDIWDTATIEDRNEAIKLVSDCMAWVARFDK